MPPRTAGETQPRKGTRRVPLACDTCRTRRSKCSLTEPCAPCVTHGFDCTYHQRDAALARQSQRASLPRDTPQHESRSLANVSSTATGPLDDGNISIAARPSPTVTVDEKTFHEDETQPKDTSNGLSGTNRHTRGTEYYGPTGTFYFLSLLRGKANARGQRGSHSAGQDSTNPRGDDGASVVNLLHSYDYCAASDAEARSGPPRLLPAPTTARPTARSLISGTGLRGSTVEVSLQKECARLYFESLHCIHPFLDQSKFLQRCHEEIWDVQSADDRRRRHGFLALFYVVLALGAITAGDASSLVWPQYVDFLNQVEPHRNHQASSSYVTIRIARMYFDKAQSYLGNVFEISSIEIAEALFLMSVFCQNAFKPHSSYMYSGMAVRAALAIGVPNSSSAGEESRLWWALYCHEIEMCASTGRHPSLRQSHYYRVPLPPALNDDVPTTQILNAMAGLADILLGITHELIDYSTEPCGFNRSAKALEHDRQIAVWAGSIPQRLSLSGFSLLESELITKQKIVLKLRLYSVRLLLHRPFLIFAATESNHEKYSVHIRACVEVSKNIIDLLYDSYANRPWFRSWWYNSSYTLDASMVLLYVVLSNLQPEPADSLLASVEKSLEIFRVMDRLAVTRKCAEITSEVLSIAREISRGNREQALQRFNHSDFQDIDPGQANGLNGNLMPQQPSGSASDIILPPNLTQEDMNASLLEMNLISNFLDPEGLFFY